MWILVIILTNYGSAIHSIDGFETRAKCEAARMAILENDASPTARLGLKGAAICIEQTWDRQ